MIDQLVERARRRDVEAFAELIGTRQVSISRIASAILGEPADADDAVQEALVAIWLQLPSLRDVSRFSAWSDRIVVNPCRLALRRRSRNRVRNIALDDDRPSEPRDMGLEDSVAQKDALELAFERLDVDQRALLVLHHVEGRPLAEIAGTFDIPIGTAKSRLHGARRALETALTDSSR